MNDFPILLAADIGLWIKVVVGVIAGLIYLANHVAQAAGKGQKRPPARPDPRPRPKPVPGRHDVQDEVAEFLRRAAEKRVARPAEQPPPPQRRSAPRSIGGSQVEIVEARAVEELPSSRWPEAGQSHLDTRPLAERADQLAHVTRAEAAFEAHMQVFEHQVGSIHEAVPSASDAKQAGARVLPAGAPLSDVFAGLLADPQSLRQAIILNEIIERPHWP